MQLLTFTSASSWKYLVQKYLNPHLSTWVFSWTKNILAS